MKKKVVDRSKTVLRQLRQIAKAVADGQVPDDKTVEEINSAWMRMFMRLKEL